MSLDIAFQIVLGMVAFLGGLWVRQLRHDLDHLKRQIDRVREDYQRRDDAEGADTIGNGLDTGDEATLLDEQFTVCGSGEGFWHEA